jgi:hypothetical protein
MTARAARAVAALRRRRQRGLEAEDLLGRPLHRAVAQQLPGEHLREPALALRLVGGGDPALDEVEVGAQALRDVRVGVGEADDEREQLAQRRARATVGDRHAQGAQPGVADRADLLEGRDAVALADGGALGDLGDQGVERVGGQRGSGRDGRVGVDGQGALGRSGRAG